MKKTLLFAFALLFATATMAQNRATIFSETFDGNAIPSGWSVMGLGQNNWRISTTNNAGGGCITIRRLTALPVLSLLSLI